MTATDYRTQTEKNAAVAWLESDYDDPATFAAPEFSGSHTPPGLFQVKPDHIGDCYCETGRGEFWTQTRTASRSEVAA